MEVHISDTARERAARDYSHLPAEAAEIAAGWLTALEDIERSFEERFNPPQPATALQMSERPRTVQEAHNIRLSFMAACAPARAGLADLLACYPTPIFVRNPAMIDAALVAEPEKVAG